MGLSSFIPPTRTLMGPGPSDVNKRVLDAMARPTIGHLDPEFIKLMDDIKELLKQAFKTNNQFTFPVSAPGSAGMEMCFVNMVEAGDKVVICRNGVFANRMEEMTTRFGGQAIMVEDEWGRAVDPNKLREALKQHPDAKIVTFVHAETSTGALSPARELCAIAKEAGCLTLVDTVTSLGGSELRVDEWQMDAVYSGTQKCLSAPPGLSPVTFSDEAIAKIKNRKSKVLSWFLDLNLVMSYWGDGARSYHHTAPINALYALHEALIILHTEGIENSWQRHFDNHLKLRAGLEDLGLSYLVPETERLPQLNSVTIPAGVDDAAIRKRLLQEHNLEIGAGLGPLAGKIWRLGLMGESSQQKNIDLCLKALKEVL